MLSLSGIFSVSKSLVFLQWLQAEPLRVTLKDTQSVFNCSFQIEYFEKMHGKTSKYCLSAPQVEKRADTFSVFPQLSPVIPSWGTQKGNQPAITVVQDGIGGPPRCASAHTPGGTGGIPTEYSSGGFAYIHWGYIHVAGPRKYQKAKSLKD